MDLLASIIEHIAICQEQRDRFLKQAEGEEAKITKLEQMYYLLEDPATEDLMRDALVGTAVQNGAAVPSANGSIDEKHYVGMSRVRSYVGEIKPGATFTVHDIFAMSIAHRGHGDPKFNHPEFEKQRKASISLALTSMTKGGDLEIVKQGRGRECTVYRKPEAK